MGYNLSAWFKVKYNQNLLKM